jgi:hypothetical protein
MAVFCGKPGVSFSVPEAGQCGICGTKWAGRAPTSFDSRQISRASTESLRPARLRCAPCDRGVGDRHGTDRRNHRSEARHREAVTRHTLPRDFGMHRVDMVR